MQISILVGSKGKNVELGEKIAVSCSKRGFKVETINLVDLDLPLYSSLEEEKAIPKAVNKLKEKLILSNCLIFVCPEYNGSVPPSFNNAICWISRAAEDWREAFNSKTAVLATHSGGGGSHVLMAMRMQLSYIGMNVIGRQLLTNYQKPLNNESLDAILDQIS